MSSQALLWISIGLIVVFAYLFWRSRRAALSPSRLRLRRQKYEVQDGASTYAEEPVERAHVKNLNVVFMYNGHSFDAYEVFGLPAGSGKSAIEEAYRKALTQNATESREFLEAAYQALIKKNVDRV